MNTKGMDAFREQTGEGLMNHAVALQAGFAGKMFPCNVHMIMSASMLPHPGMPGMFP